MKQLPVVHLRAMEPEDLDALYTIENDTSIWALGLTNVPYSRFVLHDFMSSNTGDIYTDKQVRLLIENEEKELVGMVDLLKFDPKNQKAELGILISSAFRRKGYAKAVISRIHDYALSTLHLHQLYVVIAADNDAARELFKKAGYELQGILKGWLRSGHQQADAVLMQRFL
jgi:diamine N-acetyltransferase